MGTSLLNQWNIVITSVTGTMHEKHGIVCQDSVNYIVNDYALVVAVADGAGSSSHAEFGSKAAVQMLCELFIDDFDDLYSMEPGELKQFIIDTVLDCYRDIAVEKNIDINDLSSTILFCALSSDMLIAGNLGDGIIGYQSCQELKVLFHPKNGEYANQTYFITSSDAIDVFDIEKKDITGLDGLILMTDGPSSLLYCRKCGLLAPACKTILNWSKNHPPKDVSIMLEKNISELFRKKTSDDCTIAVISRTDSP